MPNEIQIANAREKSLQELCERSGTLVSGARSYIGHMSNKRLLQQKLTEWLEEV